MDTDEFEATTGLKERRGTKPDSGERRRKSDMTIKERQEEFRLFRDKLLLSIGGLGVIGITISAIAIGVKDSALALAALTVFATLLGAPTVLRWDEKRNEKSE